MRNAILIFFLLLSHPHLSFAEEPASLHDLLLVKANSGNAEASYHLGMLYNNGIGVEKSPVKAFAFFKEAAQGGNALGHYKMGCYYGGQFGNIDGIILDAQKAKTHKQIAAEAGYRLAQHDMAAIAFRAGDTEAAVKWAKKAGEQGYIPALSSLLSLYKMSNPTESDSGITDKEAYLVLLKMKVLAPKNDNIEKLQREIESNLSERTINDIKLITENWLPSPSHISRLASQGIRRSKIVAGVSDTL